MNSAGNEVRELREEDRETWQVLWEAYNRFYRHAPCDEVTDLTFSRLCGEADDLIGIVTVEPGGQAVGLAHAVLHPSTWSTRTYCYLEDLFVADRARGSGVARSLIEVVYQEADARGADRVYWHTQQYNAPARSLYDQVARPTSFIVYQR